MEKTRLGIPVLFIEEGLHGYSGLGSTSFPIPLQLSGAWDTTLLYDVGRAIATETRAHGIDMLLAPVLCLPRDPRWGRTEETYGEDTYLDARNAVAMVKGLQGKGVDQPDAVIAAGSQAYFPPFMAYRRQAATLRLSIWASARSAVPSCLSSRRLCVKVARCR